MSDDICSIDIRNLLELTIPCEGTETSLALPHTLRNTLIRTNNSLRGDGNTIFYFLHCCKLPRPAGAKSWEFIVQAGFILGATGGLAFKLKKIYNI